MREGGSCPAAQPVIRKNEKKRHRSYICFRNASHVAETVKKYLCGPVLSPLKTQLQKKEFFKNALLHILLNNSAAKKPIFWRQVWPANIATKPISLSPGKCWESCF
jgi:hypothetical protein